MNFGKFGGRGVTDGSSMGHRWVTDPVGPRKGQNSKKLKIRALHALCNPKISNLNKNQVSNAIFDREHSIFVVLRKSHLKFAFCMEAPIFLELKNSIARSKINIFEFRKKRLLQLEELFNMSQTCH